MTWYTRHGVSFETRSNLLYRFKFEQHLSKIDKFKIKSIRHVILKKFFIVLIGGQNIFFEYNYESSFGLHDLFMAALKEY